MDEKMNGMTERNRKYHEKDVINCTAVNSNSSTFEEITLNQEIPRTKIFCKIIQSKTKQYQHFESKSVNVCTYIRIS